MLIIALALDCAGRRPDISVRKRQALGAMTALVFCVILVSECRVDADYFSALRTTRGVGLCSDALYDVQHYLEEQGIHNPFCLGWGMGRNLYVASAGRVAPIELHSYGRKPRPALIRRFEDAVKNPNSRYLLYREEVPDFGQHMASVLAFRRVVSAAGKNMILEKTFVESAGRPCLFLYRVL
jgi:hypothetical protein